MSEPDQYYWYDDTKTREELLKNPPHCFPNPESGRCHGCVIQHDCIDGMMNGGIYMQPRTIGLYN